MRDLPSCLFLTITKLVLLKHLTLLQVILMTNLILITLIFKNGKSDISHRSSVKYGKWF